MLLSRLKAAISPKSSANNVGPGVDKASTIAAASPSKIPKLEEFIGKRDFTGAIALLEMMAASGKRTPEISLWLGFSYFHKGEYKKAMETYRAMLEDKQCDPIVHVYLACSLFFLGLYNEADAVAQKGPYCKLQNRLLFHLSHKFNDETRLMSYHQNLIDIVDDQCSLASIHYLRGHYQEAIDVYKRLLHENRDDLALNVYIALCYYKLEFYDVSQEILVNYLQLDPYSVTATNLKACNYFKLFNGKAAETELKHLSERASPNFRYAEDLIKHNLVVFRHGEGATQYLPPLVDVLPEARLNLVIYHLRNDDIQSAFELMESTEPASPQEYILKAITFTMFAEEKDRPEYAKLAQQYFQLVGGSSTECDTVNGRQCMLSCFFLLKQFDEAMVYLDSIKSYMSNDDTFNVNYGQAKASTGAYEEAEVALKLVQNERFTNDYTFISHLARCFIMNRKAHLAWELYLKMETSSESVRLLNLIANDCFKTKQYFVAAKAFDILERLDANPDYWTGKRSACIGAFKMVVEGGEPVDTLHDIVALLRNTASAESDRITFSIKNWAQEVGVHI